METFKKYLMATLGIISAFVIVCLIFVAVVYFVDIAF